MYRNFGTLNKKGHTGEKEVKQVLYADDITLFVQDIVSIRRLECIFAECFRQN